MRTHGTTTGTNDDGFRRLEVITGVGRRRRWTGEEKAWIVAESLDPCCLGPERPSGSRLPPMREPGGGQTTLATGCCTRPSQPDRHSSAYVPVHASRGKLTD